MLKVKIRRMQPILTTVLIVLSILALLPLVLIVVVSFSSAESLALYGFKLIPSGWSLDGWRYVLKYKEQLVRSYGMTIYEVVVGTSLNLLVTSMFAYALSRTEWVLNRFFAAFILVSMLFSGGMVAHYIIKTSVYHMKNNLLILVLPGMMSAYRAMVMRTYIRSSIPNSLVEAAKMDGAGEMFLYFKVILPLMKPCLAALGFMTAVSHWNQWQTSMLYIDDPKKATLQLLLMRIEKSMEYLLNSEHLSIGEMIALKNAPTESMRMAILCVTMGPVLIAYPFFQKYFVKGITVGSVKG